MKGLLKNNFYAVRSSAKVFSIFMFLLGAFVIVVVSQQLLLFYMLLGIIGFSINAIASIGKDYVSKWGKYKLTAPVKRADIVKSYFICQLIWLLVGTLYSGIAVCLSWALHGCPFDNNIDVVSIFALGISISIFTGAFFFPLFYLSGEENCDVFLVISLLCGIGVVLGLISVLNLYLSPGITTILISAAVLVICSLLVFALSYPLTVCIYHKK